MRKLKILLGLLLSCGVAWAGFAKEEAIVGLSEHELGDQSLALNAGLFIPLPFLEFDGETMDSNQTLGGAGAIQWNAYVNGYLRLGLEVGMSFTFGPDWRIFLMVPVTMKATYLFNYDRFEFPLSLGLGANFIKYGSDNLYDVALIAKPGVAAYYRYNSNVSFGLNVIWWWNLEFPAADYDRFVMGNALEISPSIFYHF